MIVTFKFIGPVGSTPTVTLYNALTYALLGSGVASALIVGSHFYTVDVEVGAYSGDVLAELVNPGGAFYGNTTEGILRDAPLVRDSGVGTFPVTLTVSSGLAAVGGSVVKILKGSLVVAWGVSNVSGVVVFYLNADAYTIQIQSSAGYVPISPVALTVDGVEAVSITLTPQTVTPPPSSDTVNGTLITFDHTGIPEPGVSIFVGAIQASRTSAGRAYDSLVREILSSGGGIVVIPGMHPGVSYKIRRGTGPEYTYTVPANAIGTVYLPDIIGQE